MAAFESTHRFKDFVTAGLLIGRHPLMLTDPVQYDQHRRDDDGVIIGNVAGLTQVEADVVVSLCRVGSAQVLPPAVGLEVWLIDDPEPEANANLAFVLDDTADAIAEWRDNGERVFFHCVRAESRTPFVVAAYLARHLGIDGPTALKRVQTFFRRHTRIRRSSGHWLHCARFRPAGR